jgi:DNA polymerase II
MKGFIVYPTYKIRDGKAFVHLYGRLENGKSFVAVVERKAYFYIMEKDRKKAEKLIPLSVDETAMDFKNFDGEGVIKLMFDSPKDVPDARKILQDAGIKCYEADILFAYRYMIDIGVKGSIDIDGKIFSCKEYNSMYNTSYKTDVVFHNPEIKSADEYFPKLKILSFDIETNRNANKLYSISIYTDSAFDRCFKKVLINKKGIFNNAESFDSEKEVLKRFIEVIQEQDPDIITGWNCIDFDLNVLREMFRKHNMGFNIGRDDSPVYLRLSESFFQDSIAKIEGRVVLDGISMLKTSFVGLPDYKLETAARSILGEGKIIAGDERFNEIDKAYEEEPQKLIDYNLQDARLVIEILKNKNIIDLTITRTKLTRMQLDRVRASIAAFDSLYLEKLQKVKLVAPTAFTGDRDERIKGGYVRDSIPGIYCNILVFDFKSLYPSIIRTFNIDPFAFVAKEKIGNYSKEEVEQFIEAPNGAHFRNEEGILPSIIQELWAQRDKAKKEKDELRSYAIKIIMNSFFGILANPTCRFYSIEMANAITHFGQFLIKKTADEMMEKDYTVIGGDTDSIFIDIGEKEYNKALKKGEEIQKSINTFFTKFIKEEYNRDSKMEIEFEKVYKKFFMPSVRGAEKGAKKRYAGILEKDGKDDIDFVGLEFVRSDWTDIAKSFQRELLLKVFNDEKVTAYIRNFIKRLKKGEYDNKLLYRKQIRKPVSSYTKTTPPHIQAARKIGREEVGTIYYVMTSDGPEEADNVKHKLDYEHYIDKQIKPIAESVLAFYDEEFENLTQEHKQNSLLDY